MCRLVSQLAAFTRPNSCGFVPNAQSKTANTMAKHTGTVFTKFPAPKPARSITCHYRTAMYDVPIEKLAMYLSPRIAVCLGHSLPVPIQTPPW